MKTLFADPLRSHDKEQLSAAEEWRQLWEEELEVAFVSLRKRIVAQ